MVFPAAWFSSLLEMIWSGPYQAYLCLSVLISNVGRDVNHCLIEFLHYGILGENTNKEDGL